MSSYLSESESDEFEVSVSVISRIALFTSMMDVAVSSKNMSRIMTNIHIDARERRFGLLCSQSVSPHSTRVIVDGQ